MTNGQGDLLTTISDSSSFNQEVLTVLTALNKSLLFQSFECVCRVCVLLGEALGSLANIDEFTPKVQINAHAREREVIVR